MIIKLYKIIIGILTITISWGGTLSQQSCSSKKSSGNLEIALFRPACKVDTLISNEKTYIYKTDAYIVDGYKNTQLDEMKIDSFVCKAKDSYKNSYSYFIILLYKKSKITNNEYISNNPRDLDRYSQENDFLYDYRWEEGRFLNKTLYKGRLYSSCLICN